METMSRVSSDSKKILQLIDCVTASFVLQRYQMIKFLFRGICRVTAAEKFFDWNESLTNLIHQLQFFQRPIKFHDHL